MANLHDMVMDVFSKNKKIDAGVNKKNQKSDENMPEDTGSEKSKKSDQDNFEERIDAIEKMAKSACDGVSEIKKMLEESVAEKSKKSKKSDSEDDEQKDDDTADDEKKSQKAAFEEKTLREIEEMKKSMAVLEGIISKAVAGVANEPQKSYKPSTYAGRKPGGQDKI